LLILPVLGITMVTPVLGGGIDDIPLGTIVIDGESHSAHIADDHRTRGQGFQNVPPARIREAMIYFRFADPSIPSFHMRNVTAPLAIAWIDRDDRVIGISIMRPETSGYRPPAPVIAALEVHPDRLEPLGIARGTSIRPAE
jgi:uncharacterized membrane protein (UPF0127 family)